MNPPPSLPSASVLVLVLVLSIGGGGADDVDDVSWATTIGATTGFPSPHATTLRIAKTDARIARTLPEPLALVSALHAVIAWRRSPQLDRLDYSGDRVREHTAEVVNARIDNMTRASIDGTVAHGRDAVIRRLAELDREWDIDRALFVNFAVAGAITASTGLHRFLKRPILGVFGRRRKGMLGLFGVQLAFLFIHGAIGWCPPVSLFRRLGFRTQREIGSERHALQTAIATG